jgi:hypothetical protein
MADKNTPEPSRIANNYLTFLRQMKSESDRGSAIVSASLLDDILNGLLKSKLAPSLEKNDEERKGSSLLMA